MRSILATTLTIVLAIAACGGGAPVAVRTYAMSGCYLMGTSGELVERDGTMVIRTDPRSIPSGEFEVAWPTGFSGRDAGGGQVAVIDATGREVARTGTHVSLSGGFGPDGSFWACPPGL